MAVLRADKQARWCQTCPPWPNAECVVQADLREARLERTHPRSAHHTLTAAAPARGMALPYSGWHSSERVSATPMPRGASCVCRPRSAHAAPACWAATPAPPAHGATSAASASSKALARVSTVRPSPAAHVVRRGAKGVHPAPGEVSVIASDWHNVWGGRRPSGAGFPQAEQLFSAAIGRQPRSSGESAGWPGAISRR